MSVICKVDGKEFPSEKALHMSLKGYGLNKVKYYQTYFERRDLLTNELINFKTKEQHLKWVEEGKCQCCGAESGEYEGICDECRFS